MPMHFGLNSTNPLKTHADWPNEPMRFVRKNNLLAERHPNGPSKLLRNR